MSEEIRKPIGNLEVEDDDGKIVKIPIYHTPGAYGCNCMTCRLAKEEISLDFYKGYFLGSYIQEMFDTPEDKQSESKLDDSRVKLFFTDDELAYFITNC